MISARVVLVLGLGVVSFSVANAIKCFSCSGEECVNSATLGNVADCGEDAGTQCYSKFSGYMLTERGCSPQANAAECAEADCVRCQGDYCNQLSKDAHKCVTCSSVNDENCVSNPGNLARTQCGVATLDVTETQCYSRVIGSVTERGCVQRQDDLDNCVGPHCVTCKGEGCNNAEFPENRQKCVKCDSLQCNAITVTSYCDLPDDNCVTVARADGTYLKNCESVMSAADQQFCAGNPSSCSYCGNNECNKAAINAGQSCYTCEGTACQQTSVNIESCHTVDDTCFSMFDGFNPVRRGCRSSLDEQDRAVCDDETDNSCTLCAGAICNLVSHEDHHCQYCSSVLDANCVAAPASVVRCPAPSTEVSAEAQCYTRVVGAVTERGCLGSTADALECLSADNCQTCAIAGGGAACNTGLFPANRAQCVVGAAPSQYCPNPNDQCVQIFSNGNYIKKCQSSMSAEDVSFCGTNSNKCSFCTGNNCNQQNVAFDYLECLSCQSSTDISCSINPTAVSTTGHCLTCATVLSGATLKRGCLSTLTAAEQQQCTAANQCATCTTNRCNTAIYPTDRLSCYTCLEGECFSHDRIAKQYCPNYVAGDSCMIQLDAAGKLLRMGCRSSFTSAQVLTCSANPTLCRTCATADCNNPGEYMSTGSCVQCDSSTNPNCATRASGMEAEPCNDPLTTKCYTGLVQGRIVRGCVSDLSASDKTKCSLGQDCHQCDATKQKCNTDMYPADWVACYTCTEPPCNSHDSISLEYCPTYQANEQCVALKDQSTGQLLRLGCKSTLTTAEQSRCTANSQTCLRCSTSRCNDPATFLGASSCVQCSSSSDPDCIGKASKFVVEPCNNPLNTQCYSRRTTEGITERGCFSDLDSTASSRCQRGTDCTVCSNRNRCNVYEYPSQIKCYQCNSTQDATCKNAQSGTASYCQSYDAANRCYTVVQSNGDTVRKCSTKTRSEECEGSDLCEVCLFNGCNRRVSTDITKAVIPTPTKASASANFVHSLIVALLVVKMMMMMTTTTGVTVIM